MRGLAVFISDIRNCEYAGERGRERADLLRRHHLVAGTGENDRQGACDMSGARHCCPLPGELDGGGHWRSMAAAHCLGH